MKYCRVLSSTGQCSVTYKKASNSLVAWLERKIPQEEKTEILVSGSPRQNFGEVSNRRERWKEEEDSLYLCCGFHFSLAKLLTTATTNRGRSEGRREKEEKKIGDKDSVLKLLGAAPRAKNLEEEEDNSSGPVIYCSLWSLSSLQGSVEKERREFCTLRTNLYKIHEGTKKRFDIGQWLGKIKAKN